MKHKSPEDYPVVNAEIVNLRIGYSWTCPKCGLVHSSYENGLSKYGVRSCLHCNERTKVMLPYPLKEEPYGISLGLKKYIDGH